MALLGRQANNLREAVQNLDPRHSLSVQELNDFYIERESSPVKRIALALEELYPQKFLFTGHRGNGKSTELAKLEMHLQENFFIVRYALKNILDLHDLTYIDLLLSLVIELSKKVEVEKISLSKSTQKLLESLWSFGKDIEQGSEETQSVGREAEIGSGVSWNWLLKLGVRIKNEHATRTVLRQKVEHRISDLLQGIDILARDIKTQTGREVLCIVEDLDKANLSIAKEMFYENSNYVSAPEISVIYTFPVALSHSDEFTQILNYFSDNYTLPNFKLYDRNGNVEKGSNHLKHLLTQRVKEELFEPDALVSIIKYSGGVPRQIIRLARYACIEAMVQEQKRVSNEHVIEAVARERQNFARMLSNKQLELLKKVKNDKAIDQTEAYRVLLHNLSVLEYSNHNLWYDVNPFVDDLLNQT